ncbi:hypothetical protein [Methyloversatilis sp.]|uniref:3'-5' exonuclease n=1 Tax=Methyloversatilis sp. TaxID=2569862 RepID=UPI0035B104D4
MAGAAPLALPVFLDVEASGFGGGSYPIEVGCVLDDLSTHCFLIRPMQGWTHWDRSAESVHGISRALLEERGRDAREVAHQLNDLLAGRTVYTDAWGQDMSWLGLLYEETGVLQRFRLNSLRELLDEVQAARWHEAKASIQASLQLVRHRASTDARLLQATFARVTGFEPLAA